LEKVIILDSPGIMISREKNCIFLFAYWKNQKKTHTQSSQCMAETIATHPPTHPQTTANPKFWPNHKGQILAVRKKLKSRIPRIIIIISLAARKLVLPGAREG
jgi:hypothetical protein